ncbi:hypothetical protein Hanom_Chr04g00320881 [Helianthus anomalus]
MSLLTKTQRLIILIHIMQVRKIGTSRETDPSFLLDILEERLQNKPEKYRKNAYCHDLKR